MAQSHKQLVQGELGGSANESGQNQPLQIPGFYWDTEAKRYFKIDTTSKTSYWSPSNIRERDTERRHVDKARKRAAGESRKPRRIGRSRELANPLMGGFLARELFGPASQGTTSLGSRDFIVSGSGASNLWEPGLGVGAGEQSANKRTKSEKGRIPRLNPRAPVLHERCPAPSSCLAVSGCTNGGKRPGLDLDFQNSCLVSGYDLKGRFDMHPELRGENAAEQGFGNLSSFLMCENEDRLGMGIAYATSDRAHVRSAYLPFDKNGRIDFKCDRRPARMRDSRIYNEQIRTPGISSIKYHEPSNRIIITSEGHEASCALYLFNPARNPEDEPGPEWLLGETDFYQRIAMQVDPHTIWWTNANAIAPPSSSSLVCALGTNSGIVTFDRRGKLCSVVPPKYNPGEIFSLDFLPGHGDVVLAGGRRGSVLLADLRMPPDKFEYSAIAHSGKDWHGAEGCLSAEGRLFGRDRVRINAQAQEQQQQQQQQQQMFFRKNSNAKKNCHKKGKAGGQRNTGTPPTRPSQNVPISHVVGMNENQVLVAGIRHKMCIYDLRWRSKRGSDMNPGGAKTGMNSSFFFFSGPTAAQLSASPSPSYAPEAAAAAAAAAGTTPPLVTFPSYRNDVQLHHGLAVSSSPAAEGTGPSMGHIVAAAHDDGAVGLYSSRTGRRLPCAAADRIRGKENTPVRCLQWATMPGERQESLWMGVGTEVVGVGRVWDEREGDVVVDGGGRYREEGGRRMEGDGMDDAGERYYGRDRAALPDPAAVQTRIGAGARRGDANANANANASANASRLGDRMDVGSPPSPSTSSDADTTTTESSSESDSDDSGDD